jgi:hypothetical protein
MEYHVTIDGAAIIDVISNPFVGLDCGNDDHQFRHSTHAHADIDRHFNFGWKGASEQGSSRSSTLDTDH